MRRWLTVLLVPLAAAAVSMGQGVTVDSASQQGPITLQQADVGTATVGSSGTSASVSLGTLPLAADDMLDLSSSDASWQVSARLVSFTGYAGGLDTITLALRDGILTEAQVVVVAGIATQTSGAPIDLPTGSPAELTVVGVGAGTVDIELVATPDGGGPSLVYQVSLDSS